MLTNNYLKFDNKGTDLTLLADQLTHRKIVGQQVKATPKQTYFNDRYLTPTTRSKGATTESGGDASFIIYTDRNHQGNDDNK